MSDARTVTDAQELADALQSGATEITVNGTITGSPMVTLPPGATLRGGTLKFGAKGVRLTRDNTLDGVTVLAEEDEVAILNDTSVDDLGTLTLRDVRATGQVLIVADDAVRAGHVRVEGLRIDRADVRGRARRPHGFGVEALQGAFTLWNMQADPAVTITAELLDIGAGSADHPVGGSGVFVGGHCDWNGKADGGTVRVSELRTAEIHADGRIPPATPDLISGGVFVIAGAVVERVTNIGSVTTYGQNDMVLDNWGEVGTWVAEAPVTSNGPSGIGFVNFGVLGQLDVRGPIETNGTGARGFNHYDGTIERASFANIVTHGDGSIGVQISMPMSTFEVAGDIATSGGEGLTLVKGVQQTLNAIALSVKPGATVGSIAIGGELRTSGDDVATVEIEGEVGKIEVRGGISATGRNADGVHVRGSVPGLDGLTIASAHGEKMRALD